MRRGRKKPRGFTIVEVLISVAVISIGILGAMAALAFGMTASRDTSQHTKALNFNRRILEMCNAAFIDVSDDTIVPEQQTPAALDAVGSDTNWRQLYYLPSRPDGLSAPCTWFELPDWFATPTSPEALRFVQDEPNFQVNLTKWPDVIEDSPSANEYKSQVFRLTSQVRWREKAGRVSSSGEKWRFVRTDTVVIITN